MNITHGSILAVFFSATQVERLEGQEWYSLANDFACDLANRFDLTVDTVAGIIAALSPNNRWDRNLIDAEALIKVYALGGDPNSIKVSTFNGNKDKAIAILNGGHPGDVLGGLKVRAFYDCILGVDDAVCVDGHAYAIWLGQRVPTTKTPKITPRLYEVIANDYRLATVQINRITGLALTPAQVQAVTWVAWRNLVKNKGVQ